VHANDQYLLVIRSVEDADPPALRQVTGGPPEKIMLQFRRAGVPVAENLTPVRIDPRHHVFDCAIFPRSIHCLKYQQEGIAIGRV
jgi:hypothetical protein